MYLKKWISQFYIYERLTRNRLVRKLLAYFSWIDEQERVGSDGACTILENGMGDRICQLVVVEIAAESFLCVNWS